MFRRALVSVSDKTGLIEFLKPLVESGLTIVSSGGTADHLKKHGLPVTPVQEQTGFPEVMDGRVKTLHPRIHMALLSRPQDLPLLQKEGLEPFDLVVVNLYPFEQKPGIENIDVGGPSMIRAAAKNHQQVTVIVDPSDYQKISRSPSLEERKTLAAKAFAHTARYDSLIAQWMQAGPDSEFTIGGVPVGDLRYGENPQQTARWYRRGAEGIHAAEILQGKVLSYNNILDLEAASNLCAEVSRWLLVTKPSSSAEVPVCTVIVKHNNPCGVALGTSSKESFARAFKADPVSAFGGIVAVSGEVDLDTAKALTEPFLEAVVAPSFSTEARRELEKKKNLRLLQWPGMNAFRRDLEVRTVAGGLLVQSPDPWDETLKDWKVLGSQPSPKIQQDLELAVRVCAQLKSNSIALVSDGQTKGLGMGQVNRVEAVEHALTRLRTHHQGAAGELVLASDAFFPFADSIELAAKAGVKWIVQPGGSVKDTEVFERAAQLGVNMIVTGRRHFRH